MTAGTSMNTSRSNDPEHGSVDVGGAGRRRTGHRIHGLYGPDSEAWRLNREATLLLGAGPRALLLQIAHPLVAEGVDQHSDFRANPWARLQATLRSYLAIVYGGESVARAEIARLNRLHRRITGPVRDPAIESALGARRYAARDPELSLWVHATLIDSTIVAYDAWIEPLSEARRSAFYNETRGIGRAFGIPDLLLPADYSAFQAYVARMLGPDGPIRPTSTSRRLAKAILEPPLASLVQSAGSAFPAAVAAKLARVLDAVPSRAHDWTMWAALALLPPAVRDELGIPWNARRGLVAGWLATGFRAWRPLIPHTWRQMPQAIAADKRVVAADKRVVADRRVAAGQGQAAARQARPTGILAP